MGYTEMSCNRSSYSIWNTECPGDKIIESKYYWIMGFGFFQNCLTFLAQMTKLIIYSNLKTDFHHENGIEKNGWK